MAASKRFGFHIHSRSLEGTVSLDPISQAIGQCDQCPRRGSAPTKSSRHLDIMPASIMLFCIMFLNRIRELATLTALTKTGGLAVVWGRRRIGKTALLLEWCRRSNGLYAVADQSDAATQRRYLARSFSERLPGFADVDYPDWERLFARLAVDAGVAKFRGPIILDELPYLVAAAPELPSALQRWIDHDAKRAGLTVAVAGSSQRMMQGLVLAADAPLYGRARVLLDLGPLAPRYLPRMVGSGPGPVHTIEHWTAWGGVPRYWELAASGPGPVRDRVVALVLDPQGPLFSEPERLLLEETPTALEVCPLLDAIGAGAHRLSEIAGRLRRPATSLARPIDRLLGMGMVRREVPYGEPPRGGKRSLYRLADPFLRLWFSVVAPNRGTLTAGTRLTRQHLLDVHWDALVSTAWEELCRDAIPRVTRGPLATLGPWQPAVRFWRGNAPEWDLVAEAVRGPRRLVGEVWFTRKAPGLANIRHAIAELSRRPLPPSVDPNQTTRALFVPHLARGTPRAIDGVLLVTADQIFATAD